MTSKKALTPAQKAQMAATLKANQDYRSAKTRLRAELSIMLEERLSALLLKNDMEVRACVKLGIPKARIGREALSTTTPTAVNESLARIESLLAPRSDGDHDTTHHTTHTTDHTTHTDHNENGTR